jgi:exopolysaccharide biosynthesis polyprenyl glycosylphosphotransferase
LAERIQVGRILVGVDEVCKALKDYAIDEVIFTDVISVMPQVEEMILICTEQGVRTTIAADIFSVGLVKSGISYFGGMPLIHFQTPPGDSWELACKRAIDVCVSGCLLILLSPLFLVLALGVKTTRGPIFFRQTRVGLNGRLFQMYKFRSMFFGAEKHLKSLWESNEMKGPVFKMKNDPRITPFGRFMRRFSLDELPQLWNIFVGDMSLVGPRPPIPGEVSLYERKSRRRLSMRPGLTCTWQVSGRNEIEDFNDWVALDLQYIDNWSLTTDLMLLLRTIPAVLLGTGAR